MKEIEKIIEAYEQIDWKKEQAALGTVVKVEGSAYRRIGARIFVRNNGQWVGGISGGCLEGDALKQAQIAMLKNKSSVVVYDTMDDDAHQIGVGLGCNGRIEVLFTPIDGREADNQITFLKGILNKRAPTVLLQIIQVNNSQKQLQGRFYSTETLAGLSKEIQIDKTTIEEKIERVLFQRKSNVITLTNSKQESYEILFELIRPKIKLVCIGDNYDVNAFVEMAALLGWEIHVAGNLRKINKVIYQLSTKVHTLQSVKNIPVDEYTAVVLMSHDYKTDFELLETFLPRDLPYLGLLGPKKRRIKMQDGLKEKGIEVDLEMKSNLYSPIGLDIGAESPEEIALAILTEIIAVFRNRDGRFLKFRKGRIHR